MMIEISESKVEKMSDCAEKMLKYGGKLMQYIEELSGGEEIGERWDDEDRYFDEENMGERGGYGRGGNSGRSGSISERRGVRGTGRYSRYR